MKQLLPLLLFFLLTINTINAQTIIKWNGDGNATSWDDPDNWDLDIVPDKTHRAEITSGALINISGTQEVDQLFIDNATTTVQILVGASLEIDDSPTSVFELKSGIFKNFGTLDLVRFTSSFNIQSFFTNEASGTVTLVHNGNNGNASRFNLDRAGICTNYGTMNLEGKSDDQDLLFCDGTFVNEGILNISGEFERGLAIYIIGDFTNKVGAEINASRSAATGLNYSILWNTNEMENAGTITIEHPTDPNGTLTGIGLYLEIDDPFENTGTINIANMSQYAIWYNTDWSNTGTLNLGTTNDKLIGNSENFPRQLNNTSGTINGSGLIKCHDGLIGGTLNIGASPGEVTFQVSQDMTTVYAPIEIAGTAGPGDANGHDVIYGDRQNPFFDLVDIELGDADLDIYLLGGFQPVEGDEFLIIETDGELTGQYGIIGFPTLTDPNLYWELDYDYVEDKVTLIVSAFIVPVELVSFNAAKRNNNHHLQWTTASEINSSHFEIQMSQDAKEWKSIGNVIANGNSAVFTDYSFENNAQFQNAIYYYRLKIIDIDGSYEYSPITSIRESIRDQASVYPNPFTDQVYISSTMGFSIYNSDGKSIYDTKESVVKVDLGNAPSGIYYVHYYDNQKAQRLIKH